MDLVKVQYLIPELLADDNVSRFLVNDIAN